MLLSIIGFGFIAMLVVLPIVNGYVLSILWGWFIAPTFNLPELTVVQAIGVAIVVAYLTYQYNEGKNNAGNSDEKDRDLNERYRDEKDKDPNEKIIKLLSSVIVRPLVVLLFGWVVHLFM